MNCNLSVLSVAYQRAINNSFSDFYRALYGSDRPEKISSLSDWENLPELTKEYISKIPYTKRVFTSLDMVHRIRMTSGTTGHQPIPFPRNLEPTYQVFTNDEAPPKSILYFFRSDAEYYNALQKNGFTNCILLTGNIQNLAVTAKLAQMSDIDSIWCSISHLQVLIPRLATPTLNLIKRVDLSGERVSVQQINNLKEQFPHATFSTHYALTETQLTVGSCENISQEIIFKVDNGFYVECNDKDELLVSHVNNYAVNNCFPLIRYNTGDLAEICDVDGIQHFKIKGRSHLDLIKIPGGVIMLEIVERAIYKIHPDLTTEFELHYTSSPKPMVHILIRSRTAKKFHQSETQSIADRLAESLLVSRNYSYAKGVRDGHYQKLLITITSTLTQSTTKKKRFFVH